MATKKTKIAVGVASGLAVAAAAAAAGVYLLGGKRGAKNRAKVAKWADSAKKEVVTQLKSAKKVSKQTYDQTVDAVMKRYKTLKKIDPEELMALGAELKSHWDSIAKEMESAAKKVVQVKAKKSSAKKVTVKKASSKKRR